MSPEEFIKEIDTKLKGFADINKVVNYSSSSWLYKDDKLVSPTNTFHIYFLVKHPEKIEDIFKGNGSWLSKRLWLGGSGYIKNTKPVNPSNTAVRQLYRTIYDNVVFSPERLTFIAQPVLNEGLKKTNHEAYFTQGETDFLDLSQFSDITEQEQKRYVMLINHAKSVNRKSSYMVECKKHFDQNIGRKVEAGEYDDRAEYKHLHGDEIVRREYEASINCELLSDHIVEFDSGEKLSVKEILSAPELYHKQCCKDPHEPDYGNSNIAVIYSNQERPVIFSHAHGGTRYKLYQENNPLNANLWSKDYWLKNFFLVTYDKKNDIYYREGNRLRLYSHAGFTNTFAGYKLIGEDSTSAIDATKWWINNVSKQCIGGDGFAPNQPVVYEKNGDLLLNEYAPEILLHGFEIPTQNECLESAKPWLNHISKMIHRDDEANILIDWFAYLVQYPHERPTFSPLVLSETRGVGKDMMVDIFARLFGHKYCKKSSIENLSKAESWGDPFYHSKLITVSECGSSTDRYTIGNEIKDSITRTTMSMNLKGNKIVTDNVYCGIIFFSNSKSPFRLDENDRRFFVTRCDWTKADADKIKADGHFIDLAKFYSESKHLHGLYHYLLNRKIQTSLKGDAPMTSTKEIMSQSEPNKIEQFFKHLAQHPCRYWKVGMIDDLFLNLNIDEYGTDNKQYKRYLRQLLDAGKIKFRGNSYRIKTLSMLDADKDNDMIRQNMEEHWGKTTGQLILE